MKDINYDGAVRLAQAILIQTHNDYIEALKTIMSHRRHIKKIYTTFRKYDTWRNEHAIYKSIHMRLKKSKNKKNILTSLKPDELNILKHHNIKPPQKITKQENKILDEYILAWQDKQSIEKFYKSDLFAIYTLGGSIKLNINELIEQLKAEAHWDGKEEDELSLCLKK